MWGWSVAAVAVVRVDGCAALPAGERTEKAFDGRLSRTAVATGRLSWEREGKRTERRLSSGLKRLYTFSGMAAMAMRCPAYISVSIANYRRYIFTITTSVITSANMLAKYSAGPRLQKRLITT